MATLNEPSPREELVQRRPERRQALVLLAGGCVAMASAMASAQAPHSAVVSSGPHSPRGAVIDGTSPADPAGWVFVWVDLALPELASLPRERRAERDALRADILVQQDTVMARLRELGATEEARVQQVRNALAVRLPGAALEAARRIPGVRRLRAVRHIRREPPSSKSLVGRD